MKKFGLAKQIGEFKEWVRLFNDNQRVMEFPTVEEAEIFRQQMEFPSTYKVEEIPS